MAARLTKTSAEASIAEDKVSYVYGGSGEWIDDFLDDYSTILAEYSHDTELLTEKIAEIIERDADHVEKVTRKWDTEEDFRLAATTIVKNLEENNGLKALQEAGDKLKDAAN
jgi:hypothetical protein